MFVAKYLGLYFLHNQAGNKAENQRSVSSSFMAALFIFNFSYLAGVLVSSWVNYLTVWFKKTLINTNHFEDTVKPVLFPCCPQYILCQIKRQTALSRYCITTSHVPTSCQYACLSTTPLPHATSGALHRQIENNMSKLARYTLHTTLRKTILYCDSRK